jgi:hypothetical protein
MTLTYLYLYDIVMLFNIKHYNNKKIMETNENLELIVNNQGGMDLLNNSYILKYQIKTK